MCTKVDITKQEREILKMMWDLNNKIAEKVELTYKEKLTYNRYLDYIKRYYQGKAAYWWFQGKIK